MKKEMKQLLIKGSAATACGVALGALPMISAQVSTQDAQTTQKAMAMSFDLDKQTLFTPSYATKMAYVYRGGNEAGADAFATRDIEALDYAQISTAKLASQDSICMAQAIYYEARSEPIAGQKAVAEVVVNRVRSKHFPDTVCSVVFEGAARTTGCQFSFTCDGTMNQAPTGRAWERSKALADHVLMGANHAITARATHYHTDQVDPNWAYDLKPTRTIGSHVFYKFKNRREVAGVMRSVAP